MIPPVHRRLSLQVYLVEAERVHGPTPELIDGHALYDSAIAHEMHEVARLHTPVYQANA